ncbi:hypothetical protein BY458DRAFT_560498 [Sporodiniella umbellata]|nr:hypothetical protein BY458DRAFT_560498 [Sporodiniella umbellata]
MRKKRKGSLKEEPLSQEMNAEPKLSELLIDSFLGKNKENASRRKERPEIDQVLSNGLLRSADKNNLGRLSQRDLLAVDWDQLDLGPSEYLFTSPQEKMMELQGEAGEWFSDIDSEDGNDRKQEITESISRQEEPLFIDLLEAINVKGGIKAFDKGQHFPRLDETALYATGYLFREYVRYQAFVEAEKKQKKQDLIQQRKEKRRKFVYKDKGIEETPIPTIHLYEFCQQKKNTYRKQWHPLR